METNTTAESETIVVLTEDAANEVRSMQAKSEKDAGKPLRVYVESGGCSGMQYGMVFDEEREGDKVVEFFGVSVVVDEFSTKKNRRNEKYYKDTQN